jgi:hypothetical protein
MWKTTLISRWNFCLPKYIFPRNSSILKVEFRQGHDVQFYLIGHVVEWSIEKCSTSMIFHKMWRKVTKFHQNLCIFLFRKNLFFYFSNGFHFRSCDFHIVAVSYDTILAFQCKWLLKIHKPMGKGIFCTMFQWYDTENRIFCLANVVNKILKLLPKSGLLKFACRELWMPLGKQASFYSQNLIVCLERPVVKI